MTADAIDPEQAVSALAHHTWKMAFSSSGHSTLEVPIARK
jgi:hypothetical protein